MTDVPSNTCGGCDACDGTGEWCRLVLLSPAERSCLAALLRREANRCINRIEPGDPVPIRDAMIAAAQDCDDIWAKIERVP